MDASELSELIDLAYELSQILIQKPKILQEARLRQEIPTSKLPDMLRSAILSKDTIALTFLRNIYNETFERVKLLYWNEGEKDRYKRRVVSLACWLEMRVDEIMNNISQAKQLN